MLEVKLKLRYYFNAHNPCSPHHLPSGLTHHKMSSAMMSHDMLEVRLKLRYYSDITSDITSMPITYALPITHQVDCKM